MEKVVQKKGNKKAMGGRHPTTTTSPTSGLEGYKEQAGAIITAIFGPNPINPLQWRQGSRESCFPAPPRECAHIDQQLYPENPCMSIYLEVVHDGYFEVTLTLRKTPVSWTPLVETRGYGHLEESPQRREDPVVALQKMKEKFLHEVYQTMAASAQTIRDMSP